MASLHRTALGELIPIDPWGMMMWDIIRITILPIVAGLIFNFFLELPSDGAG